MKLNHLALLGSSLFLVSCAASVDKGTIGQLKRVKPELADERIEGGIEKAMRGYQKFLDETPESSMTPEAIRRLADLKIEKEYGVLESGKPLLGTAGAEAAAELAAPERASLAQAAGAAPLVSADRESAKDFEARATQAPALAGTADDGTDLHNAGALEAIELYKKLLLQYPNYERNDQVLYQMSRAYEELGNVDEAMNVMNRIAKDYPMSRYVDEIQFRRGEYYFTRKRFLDAENAYKVIVSIGESSFFYELSRYKLGWTFYKQDMHEEALNEFVALLDYKVKTGFDLEKSKDELERKRVEDTYRVVSLSFSALGGADAVVAYFDKNGRRSYEVNVYSNLAEHYLEKRRYADSAATYKAFVKRNPYHKVAPHFDMRVIDIYKQGGFPRLVIEANKDFARSYGLKSEYWKHFSVADYPDVLGYLKTNLKELANHYHALYQNKQYEKQKAEHFQEASHWYAEFLESFPKDAESPVMNYQLADLLLENKDFGLAAVQYERTAYDYPAHDKSAAAAYAAVYAYREDLSATKDENKQPLIRKEVIRSSLRFADSFPQHEKAALVMGAALDDIYGMKDYAFAVTTGRKMLTAFPQAETGLRRSAWLVVAHSSYELASFKDAEEGYINVLALTAAEDKSRADLEENLAASIYKQGEQASVAADYRLAASHFLRVAKLAPKAKIRPTAEYDAAVALINLKDWDAAASVLQAFRSNFPGHELLPEVTKKIAHVYHEAGKLALAAAEYERIERESKDVSVRREALTLAAELYGKANEPEKAIQVHRRYIDQFPKPLELALENRQKIADILKAATDQAPYIKELKLIVEADAKAGGERTARTRYLGGTAALVLTEPLFQKFADISLKQPFDKSLKNKKLAMKAANDAFGKLMAYEVGDVSAAATYYIAESYYNFSASLKQSERPRDLDELEREQYEEALDEQSYPFEEKAIQIHQKNVDFIVQGVYNRWVDKSMARLATIMPGRYAKPEESTGFIQQADGADYRQLTDPPVIAPTAAAEVPAANNPAAESAVTPANGG